MSPKRSARGPARSTMAVDDEEPLITVLDESGNQISDDTPVNIEELAPDIVEDEQDPPGEDPIEILRREKDAAVNLAAAEKKRADAAEHRAQGTDADLEATNAAVLKHAAAQARGEVETATAAYATAMAANDFAAAGKAQALIAEKVAEAREFEAAHADFERSMTERRAAPKVTTQPAPAAEASLEDRIRANLTPKSADWAIRNKDKILSSNAAWHSTIAAHHKAIEAGHEIDTPDYFKFLEGDLGIEAGGRTTPATRSTPKPAPKRAPPMAAAPVTKGSTTATAGTVTLTAAERVAAKRFGMTPTKYAANKLKALKAAEDPDYQGPRYSQHNPAIQQGRR